MSKDITKATINRRTVLLNRFQSSVLQLLDICNCGI